MNKDLFEQSVKNKFSYLEGKYGFLSPTTEDSGREVFVKFERGFQTVSVSCELGHGPVIEIFYPATETGDKPIPWAAKDGIQRARRFPRLKTKTEYSENDEISVKNYINETALAFEVAESEWLNGLTNCSSRRP